MNLRTNTKKLELRQAKQQSQDLNRTDEFLNALLDVEPGQQLPKPPHDLFQPPPVVNGVSPHKEHISPFSQPPAPPPQLPLPEKPDASPIPSERNGISNAKGDDIEKHLTEVLPSEKKLEKSGQILQPGDKSENLQIRLVEALTSTQKKLDTQENRVKQLEEELKQERQAREFAEQRAKYLLENSLMTNGTTLTHDDTASTTSEETVQLEDNAGTVPEIPATTTATQEKEIDDAAKERLQQRLDLMLKEMAEVKEQMESYKRRAEVAEEEKSTLAEMVERIREGEKKSKSRESSIRKKKSTEMSTQTDSWSATNGSAYISNQDHAVEAQEHKTNGTVDKSLMNAKPSQLIAPTALSLHHDDRLVQSAPYASIVGVVLIGVGIMAYLNGWQKLEGS
jgi:hypothetical protein